MLQNEVSAARKLSA